MLNQRKSKLISFLFVLPAFIFFSDSFRQDRSQHGRGHYGQAGLREGRHVAPLTKYWSLSTPARKCSLSIIVTEKSCTTPRPPKQKQCNLHHLSFSSMTELWQPQTGGFPPTCCFIRTGYNSGQRRRHRAKVFWLTWNIFAIKWIKI